MAASDLELIQAWTHQRDARAFAALYDRHGGLVYNTCLRVLRNGSDAEEVAQECFLELSRAGDTIRAFVPARLHTLATWRALDRIRGGGASPRTERALRGGTGRGGGHWVPLFIGARRSELSMFLGSLACQGGGHAILGVRWQFASPDADGALEPSDGFNVCEQPDTARCGAPS